MAPSKASVDKFYNAAVTAGGVVARPPSEGVDESAYYCATVLDLDSNEVGAMYRPQSGYGTRSDAQRISNWQRDVASSSVAHDQLQKSSESPRIIVNNITSNPAVQVHRIKPEQNGDGEISTRAIIGTLLGASAGAAVAYAMAKSEPEKPRESSQRQMNGQTIDGTQQHVTEIIYGSEKAIHLPLRPIQMIDREADEPSQMLDLGSRIKTVSSSRHSALATPPDEATSIRSGRTLAQTNGTKILIGGPKGQTSFSKQQHPPTVEAVKRITSKPSSHSPTVRTAKDVPLPASRVSNNLTTSTVKEKSINDLATVVPDDSISQVSTRRLSNHDHRHSHHHHHHHHHHTSKPSHTSKHARQSSHGSGQTIKESDYRKSSSHRR